MYVLLLLDFCLFVCFRHHHNGRWEFRWSAFSHNLLAFLWLIVSFCFPHCAEAFSLMQSHLLFYAFCLSFQCHIQKIIVRPHVKEFASYILYWCFMIWGLTLKSLIPVDFCVWYKIGIQFLLLHVVVLFSHHHLLKRLSISHYTLLAPLSKIS